MTGGKSVGCDTAPAPRRRARSGAATGRRKPARRLWITAFGLLLLIGAPTGGQAQRGSQDDRVTVNYDILTNLDWAASVSAAELGGRRAALLSPPDQIPVSRLLIKPAHVASRTPEPSKPAPSESARKQPSAAGQTDGSPLPEQPADAPMESPARVLPLEPRPPPPEPLVPVPPAKNLAAQTPVRLPEPDSPEPAGAMALAAPAKPAANPVATAPATQPAASQPAAPQTAALPPGGEARDRLAPGDFRLLFATSGAELSPSAEQRLVELADRLRQEETRRIQIMSYASAADESVSRARRLSLSRALAVRTFLIDKGVPSTRIDVRALGSDVGDGPADRIDVVDARR